VSLPSGPHFEAVIALGANLGDAPLTVEQALHNLAKLPHTELLRASSLYRTAPVDATGPDFINAVALVRTQLSPHALLTALQQQENEQGRLRPYRNAPRTLDLDMVRMFSPEGEVLLNDSTLTLPHPRMLQRAFVLVPLAEIAPEQVSAKQLAAVATQTISRLG
jgi:2-amino-4-hydroxy-6-hydroxymethyldihydropteridine diphosphokinase